MNKRKFDLSIKQNINHINLIVMTTQNANQAYVNASYVVNPAKGEVKVVVTKKKDSENGIQRKTKTTFTKTYYSIDTNGGGYAGL